MDSLAIVMNWAYSVDIETVIGATVTEFHPRGLYSSNGNPGANIKLLQLIYGKCDAIHFKAIYGQDFDLTQLPKIAEKSKKMITAYHKEHTSDDKSDDKPAA